jgi:anti-sigma regulatory factor (Ser/Thr protein kinase)
MPVTTQLLSLEIPCDLHAPALVRAALAEIDDRGWSLDDGLLVASELVSNAVRHSGGSALDRLRVDIGRRRRQLLISVHDPGFSGQTARRAAADRSMSGGWGLRIVEQLCDDWGSERSDGYCVWAQLVADADDGEPDPGGCDERLPR